MIIKTNRKAAISKLGLGDLLIASPNLNNEKYEKKIFALSKKENGDSILVSLTKGDENLESSSRDGLLDLILSTFDDDFKIVKYDDYQIEGTVDSDTLDMKDIVRDKFNKYFLVDVVDAQYCLLSISYDLGDKQRFVHSSLEDLNKDFQERAYWHGLEKLNYKELDLKLYS